VPCAASEVIAARIPGAQLYLFDGRGHIPMCSATEEFCAALGNFIRTSRGERTTAASVCSEPVDAALKIGTMVRTSVRHIKLAVAVGLSAFPYQAAIPWPRSISWRSHAGNLFDRGNPNLLAPIYGRFTEGFDTADLKKRRTIQRIELIRHVHQSCAGDRFLGSSNNPTSLA
jgi:hypothetical protein